MGLAVVIFGFVVALVVGGWACRLSFLLGVVRGREDAERELAAILRLRE